MEGGGGGGREEVAMISMKSSISSVARFNRPFAPIKVTREELLSNEYDDNEKG